MAQILDYPSDDKEEISSGSDKDLVAWVVEHVRDGRDYRNSNFKDQWDEYYRLWRGIWSEEDKTRGSERSKLISPALQQAIEAAVAELEEATFGRGQWFDVSDDIEDEDKVDVGIFRTLLLQDLDDAGVQSAMSEVFLNGALYGTGIGKIVVEDVENRSIQAAPINGIMGVNQATAIKDIRAQVRLVAVPNDEFVIDPSAKTIDDALYCAQEMVLPRHIVTMKQDQGIYRDVDLGSYPDDEDVYSKGEKKSVNNSDKVKVTEYHGLVPAKFINKKTDESSESEGSGMFDTEDDDLVEVIVTIANDSVVLKAVENPYTMGDRCFIAYQHDTVPNRFWGRGVAEKGYNPQKALDAELRGRMDAMALSIHPMMAMDATRIPRGGDLSVRPGRTILTNGDPRTVLMPFNFGNVGTNTFAQSGDLERMIQMGTGSMDSATPVSINPRNSTASGMSMMLGGAIKRSKRTLANIERNFTSPLIHKAAWRYMQFAPERYPITDVRFTVHSTLGIMARELEQQQLTQLLSTVPAESPAFWMLIRSIYENSSISNRDQMIQIIEKMMQQALNPQPPQPTPADMLKQQEMQLKAQAEQSRIHVESVRAFAELARVRLEAEKAVTTNAKTEADTMLTLAQTQSVALDQSLKQLKAMTDALQAESERKNGQTAGTEVPSPIGNVQQQGMEGINGGNGTLPREISSVSPGNMPNGSPMAVPQGGNIQTPAVP